MGTCPFNMVTKKITFVKQVKNQDSKDRAADKKTVDPDRIGASDRSSKTGRPKRVCLFCQNETNPTYTDQKREVVFAQNIKERWLRILSMPATWRCFLLYQKYSVLPTNNYLVVH